MTAPVEPAAGYTGQHLADLRSPLPSDKGGGAPTGGGIDQSSEPKAILAVLGTEKARAARGEMLLAELRRADPALVPLIAVAPPGAQAPALALLLLGHELRRIPASVTEPLLGQIRRQWWEDAIAALPHPLTEGSPRIHVGNPVLEALALAAAEDRLNPGLLTPLFDRLEPFIEAQGRFAEAISWQDFLTHAYGVPLTVAAQTAVPGLTSIPLGALGRAYGVLDTWRGLPRALAEGRQPMPEAWLAAEGLSTDGLLLGGFDRAALARVGQRVATLAQEALDRLERERRLWGRAQRWPLALVPVLRLQLGALARAGFDPFAARVQMAHPLAPLAAAWGRLRA